MNKKSDGSIVVDIYGDKAPLTLNLKIPLEELIKKKRIVLDVIDDSGKEWSKLYPPQ